MTREEREKHLDWLYRLKSEIFVFMPKDWVIPFADALDVAIKALEQESTTKNDLRVDCISRQFMYELGATCIATRNENGKLVALGAIEELPSVTPQEPQSFKWCRDCKEYDQEKHCCHRWSKVIRDTVEEMKQEYIEREVLDNIRAEITTMPCAITSMKEVYVNRDKVISILDKYKAEIEPQESDAE